MDMYLGCAQHLFIFWRTFCSIQARTQGGALGAHAHPPPPEKMVLLRNAQKRREVPPRYVGKKKFTSVPLRYDKIKTKKVRKKKERDKIKERKRIAVCRNSRNYKVGFFMFIYHYCRFGNK